MNGRDKSLSAAVAMIIESVGSDSFPRTLWRRPRRFVTEIVQCESGVAQKAKSCAPQWWRGTRFRDSLHKWRWRAAGAAALLTGAAAVTPSTPKCPANPLIQLRLGIICRCSPMMAEAAGSQPALLSSESSALRLTIKQQAKSGT